MPPGEARTADTSRLRALQDRRWSHRRPVTTGAISALTLLFWAVWAYLVVPLVTAVLWFFGVRLFGEQMGMDGYDGLRQSLLAYSTVLLTLVGLLAAWIAWNVIRYGGSHDRRTVKSAEVTDPEVWAAFQLDDSLLEPLRRDRMARIDVNEYGCVVVIAPVAIEPSVPSPPLPWGSRAASGTGGRTSPSAARPKRVAAG